MSLQLRKALKSDNQAISNVVAAAFGISQSDEIIELIHELSVDSSAEPCLSIVATIDENIVGHIMFTKALITDSQDTVASILAPLAVHPKHQNQGIGGCLIEEGIQQLKAINIDLVFVLGHPKYYPKYGFTPAGIKGLNAPYTIAPENAGAWMVRELKPGIIENTNGTVICADTLQDAKYWQE